MTSVLRQQRGLLNQEFIQQHPEVAKLNPSTVNTVRLYTLIGKTGVCDIILRYYVLAWLMPVLTISIVAELDM